MRRSIYVDREDAFAVEDEERSAFVRYVLEAAGIPLENAWPENEDLTVQIKIQLRKLLAKFDVIVLDDGDHGTEIYVGDDLIAQWHKPKYILHTDITQRERSKRTFYEMIIEYESVFDEEEDSSSKERS